MTPVWQTIHRDSLHRTPWLELVADATLNAALCHGCYRRTHFVEICVEGCAECAAEGLNPLAAVSR